MRISGTRLKIKKPGFNIFFIKNIF